MSYEVVALLPVKQHSERVPGKNFRDLSGRPLIRWMVDNLLGVSAIETIVINTDAPEEVSRSLGGAEGRILIRERRTEICGDLVSMNLIIEDDLQSVSAATYIMTHATNPFLSSETIQSALDRYRTAVETGESDSLFSVNKHQTRFYRTDASAINHDPAVLIRTQDLEPWFEENSGLYIFSAASFQKTGARIGESPLLFETPRLESVDIDDVEDWMMAEAIAQWKLERGGDHG